MRLPINPPSNPPTTAPPTRFPGPATAEPISAPDPAPSSVPVPSFGPIPFGSPAQAASARPKTVTAANLNADISTPGYRRGENLSITLLRRKDSGKTAALAPIQVPLDPRQHQFGAQTADRRGAELEFAAIQRGKFDHNRQPQPRARLGFIEPAAAMRHLLALGRRQAAAVIVHHDPQYVALAQRIGPLAPHFDRHTRRRPLAGIVHQVADHLFEIGALAAELRDTIGVYLDGDAAVAMNLLHGAGERGDDRRDLGDRAHHCQSCCQPRALEMPRHLVAHDVGLLQHLVGEGVSRASGAISSGNCPASRSAVPERIAARLSEMRLSGARPNRTWNMVVSSSTAPRIENVMISA